MTAVLSFIGINVIHHQIDFLLGQLLERRALGEDSADHFMCHFASTLLVGTLRVTIEHAGTDFSIPIAFYPQRISKFAAPVSLISNSA